MTAPPAALCGHRWGRPWCADYWPHVCQLDADHTDPCPCPAGTCTAHCKQPPAHRCRCGATTTKETTRDA